jgi:hypothetical protein
MEQKIIIEEQVIIGGDDLETQEDIDDSQEGEMKLKARKKK